MIIFEFIELIKIIYLIERSIEMLKSIEIGINMRKHNIVVEMFKTVLPNLALMLCVKNTPKKKKKKNQFPDPIFNIYIYER